MKCCICKKSIVGFGHNPNPIKQKGQCCDKCNVLVIQERLKQKEQIHIIEAVVNAVLILDEFANDDYHTELYQFCKALYNRGIRVNEKDIKLL